MTSALERRLSNPADTILVDGMAHRPGSPHATAARRPALTSVGHAHATHVRWCRDSKCYPHGAPA